MSMADPDDGLTGDELDRRLGDLAGLITELADADWVAAFENDPTPDTGIVRGRSLITMTAMLATISQAAIEPVENFLGGMTMAMLESISTEGD